MSNCNYYSTNKVHLWILNWISDIRLSNLYTQIISFVGSLSGFKSLNAPWILLINILSLQAVGVTQFAHREPLQQASCNLELLSWWAGQLVLVLTELSHTVDMVALPWQELQVLSDLCCIEGQIIPADEGFYLSQHGLRLLDIKISSWKTYRQKV